MEEVAQHNTPDDLWIVIYGRVYDVTEWQNEVSLIWYYLIYFVIIRIKITKEMNLKIASRRGFYLTREWWKGCLRGIQKCSTFTRCTSYSLQFHYWTSQETREQTLNASLFVCVCLFTTSSLWASSVMYRFRSWISATSCTYLFHYLLSNIKIAEFSSSSSSCLVRPLLGHHLTHSYHIQLHYILWFYVWYLNWYMNTPRCKPMSKHIHSTSSTKKTVINQSSNITWVQR